MEHFLTKNEARVLQTVKPNEGLFLYELASVAQLTPADAFETAKRLDSRGYLVFDSAKRFVMITGKGMTVKEDISGSSVTDTRWGVRGCYVITTDDAPKSLYEKLSESDVSEAIDAELGKRD